MILDRYDHCERGLSTFRVADQGLQARQAAIFADSMKQTSFEHPEVWGRRLCGETVQPPRTTCQGSGSHQAIETVENSRTDSVR
jgi:hypothetical protein